jgi:hypothetical protein
MRQKLLSSSHPPEGNADRSTERGRPFEASGIASVYSDQHTASGEYMNPAAMTAAHRTLPFGSRVTVVNLGGRSYQRSRSIRERAGNRSQPGCGACFEDRRVSIRLTNDTAQSSSPWMAGEFSALVTGVKGSSARPVRKVGEMVCVIIRAGYEICYDSRSLPRLS